MVQTPLTFEDARRLGAALLLMLGAIGIVPHPATAAGEAAQAAAPSRDEQEIARLERELVAAIAAKDLKAYDRLVGEDYVVVNASGEETTKAQVVAAYTSGERGYSGLQIDEVKAHVFGDTGIVSARTLGMRHENGTDVPNRVRYVRVYARRQGVWRAVSQMAAPLP